MNNKIKTTIGILIIAIGLFILPIVMAQQENDYRAFVTNEQIDRFVGSDGTNITLTAQVNYVPIYPSVTYTFTAMPIRVSIDMSKPTAINTQIATAVKEQGADLGKNVIRVFLPSYEMKIP